MSNTTKGASSAVDETNKLTETETGFLIESWKQAIDVQKHFNDICLKIRNTAITTLGTGLAATGLLVDNDYSMLVPTRPLLFSVVMLFATYIVLGSAEKGFFNTLAKSIANMVVKQVPVLSSIRFRFLVFIDLILVAFVVWNTTGSIVRDYRFEPQYQLNMGGVCLFALALVLFIFYVLDRNWYHQLLKGAVRSSIEIEKRLEKAGVSSFTLGRYIKKESDINLGNITLNAGRKLEFVYKGVIVLLFVMSFVLSVYGSGLVGKNPETIAELNTRIGEYRSENLKLKDANVKLLNRINSMRVQAEVHQREHELQTQLLLMYKNFVPIDTIRADKK